MQGFNQGNQVLLAFPFQRVQPLRQLELVTVDDLLHEALPIAVEYLFKGKLSLDLAAATLDVLTIGGHLELDDLDI